MKSKCKISKNSYSLMEVLIAMGMLVLLSLAVTSISIAAVRASVLAKHRLQAVFIAQEQLEIIRNIRDSNLANLTMGAFDDMWYGAGSGCSDLSPSYCGQELPDTTHLCCDTNEISLIKNTTIFFSNSPPPDINRYYIDLRRNIYDTDQDLVIEELKGNDIVRITYNTKIQITTLRDTTIKLEVKDGTWADITLSYLRPGYPHAKASVIEWSERYDIIRKNAPRRIRVIVEWKEQTTGMQQLVLEEVLTNLMIAP